MTSLCDHPRPGSDDISRACEEAWVGDCGYRRADGSQQRYALAFQGTVIAADGKAFVEAFLVDLPEDPAELMQPGERPLAGTPTTRPAPPLSVSQRRLTFTSHRRFPGIRGPRHWLRSSPDGAQIAMLMHDDQGVVQLFTISPLGGTLRQVTHNRWSISSAFTWSPDGHQLAVIADGSVMTVDVATGQPHRLTDPVRDETAPRPEACVFSPDGDTIAYVRTVPSPSSNQRHNQIFVVGAKP